MSIGCHLFFGGDPSACFRVTVNNIVAATFTFNRQTLPFRTDFHLAGARCFFSTNSHDLLQATTRWRAVTTCASTQSFEMEIIVDPAIHSDCERSAHFRGLRHLVFAALPPHGFISFDLLRKRVQGVLTPTASADDTFWNSLLLPITIGVLGTTMGVAPLHCACLDRDGSALLLAGHSGAGKSTLTAALAQRGFALVSDDWTYISRNDRALVAHGLLAPIKLLPDTVRFFPQLRDFAPNRTLNGELAFEIDPRLLRGVSVKEISRPRWIFLLERTAARDCHFVPCRPEYVREFFERNAERLPCELREAQMTRSSLIQELSEHPSWIVRSGESPQDTAGAISHFALEARNARA
jgi:hypothetical protein